MWVKDSERHPTREDEYPVRRKTQAEGKPYAADVCAWIPNKLTRRSCGVWVNIRRGGKVYDVLEWWEDDPHD